LPFKYGAENFDDKFKNKKALRERFGLRDDFKPLFGYVGRLDDQKGLGLVKHALYWAIRNNCQFVLLGTGAHHVNQDFWRIQRELNGNPDCHLEIGFSEELARLLYAGCDYMVVPSVFEPCGLTQMIALRYGTPPIVRYTGGLADTVFDWDHDGRPREERNGFIFHHEDAAALESAMRRANGLFYSPDNYYRQLGLQGMKCDFSWKSSAGHYINAYEFVRHK
jgi:starch synthase